MRFFFCFDSRIFILFQGLEISFTGILMVLFFNLDYSVSLKSNFPNNSHIISTHNQFLFLLTFFRNLFLIPADPYIIESILSTISLNSHLFYWTLINFYWNISFYHWFLSMWWFGWILVVFLCVDGSNPDKKLIFGWCYFLLFFFSWIFNIIKCSWNYCHWQCNNFFH